MASPTRLLSAEELSKDYLQQQFQPTAEQAKVISAPHTSSLVVAGAGAGKTETMAARVVWLIANKICRPDEILGLTFTKKAASELEARIRTRLYQLMMSPLCTGIGADEELAAVLRDSSPEISTYDSYAGSLVRSYGLLAGVETAGGIVGSTAFSQHVHAIVSDPDAQVPEGIAISTVVDNVRTLFNQLTDNLLPPERATYYLQDSLPWQGCPSDASSGVEKVIESIEAAHENRLILAKLVEKLAARLREQGVFTFGGQMLLATELVDNFPKVVTTERAVFTTVLLDEYQDTNHAQRVLLTSLFGGSQAGTAVTAVGDPMQCIYGWRGASISNILQFCTDFPLANAQPSPRNHLTTSWRNPEHVLSLVNEFSHDMRSAEGMHVPDLLPRAGAPLGDIRAAFVNTTVAESDWIAEQMASIWRTDSAPPSAAVLISRNEHAQPVAQALHRRGIPYEILSLGSALDNAKVQDALSLLVAVLEPESARGWSLLLTNQRYPFGADDIRCISRHVRQENSSAAAEQPQQSDDIPRMVQQMAEQLRAPASACIADIIFSSALLEDLSEAGAWNLRRLHADIARVRKLLGMPLAEIISGLESIVDGSDISCSSQHGAEASAAAASFRVLHQLAANAGSSTRMTIGEFLHFLTLAQDEQGDEAHQKIAGSPGKVHILTIYGAKGLEWEAVAVPAMNEKIISGRSLNSDWRKSMQFLPAHMRGDRDSNTGGHGYPSLADRIMKFPQDSIEQRAAFLTSGGDKNVSSTGDESELSRIAQARVVGYDTVMKQRDDEEMRRLLYVAMTRTEHYLFLSGHRWKYGRKTPYKTSPFFTQVLDIMSKISIPVDVSSYDKGLTDELPETEVDPIAWPEPRETVSPQLRERILHRTLTETTDDDHEIALLRQWVEVYCTDQLDSPTDTARLVPTRLTASEVVSLSSDSDRFLKQRARPVPLQPNPYARKGTQFHTWLENRLQPQSLLSLEDLPGASDEGAEDADLEALKDSYNESSWAAMTPYAVEAGFDFTLAGTHFTGRIDAVYLHNDGTWSVIDWKTGQLPTASKLEHINMQLAIYRIGWAERISSMTGKSVDPSEVKAGFHYVRFNTTVYPSHIGGRDDIIALLEQG